MELLTLRCGSSVYLGSYSGGFLHHIKVTSIVVPIPWLLLKNSRIKLSQNITATINTKLMLRKNRILLNVSTDGTISLCEPYINVFSVKKEDNE